MPPLWIISHTTSIYYTSQREVYAAPHQRGIASYAPCPQPNRWLEITEYCSHRLYVWIAGFSARRCSNPVDAIIADEKYLGASHGYITLVLSAKSGESLFMGKGRNDECLEPFFMSLTQEFVRASYIWV